MRLDVRFLRNLNFIAALGLLQDSDMTMREIADKFDEIADEEYLASDAEIVLLFDALCSVEAVEGYYFAGEEKKIRPKYFLSTDYLHITEIGKEKYKQFVDEYNEIKNDIDIIFNKIVGNSD